MLVMENKATYIRRQVQAEILRLFFEGRLIDEIDALPRKLYPRGGTQSASETLYRDRAITVYRIMAALGISIEEEPLDPLPLSVYARRALERNHIDGPVLTVIDEACEACIKTSYYVTDACRGCLARPCSVNCPRDAISFDGDRAKIDAKTCINCGRCQGVCPYNAIVFIPVPCEQGCPVNAIRKNEKGKEYIDYDACIFCGRCSRACPFGAIMERSQALDVAVHIMNGAQVIAMGAPSIIGQFPGSPGQTVGALHEVGFAAVMEVATGADQTARVEAEEFIERMQAGAPVMGTSCCPAYTEAVKKHVQAFIPFVSHARTPMSYTAESTVARYPDAITVFIGPCIAKKFEGMLDANVHYVLTYEEVGALLMARGIQVQDAEETEFDSPSASAQGRGFPVSEGVTGAVMKHVADRAVIRPVMIDGLKRKGLGLLKACASGKAPGNLIEVMSCEGGCICGPGVVSNPKITAQKLRQYLAET